MGNKPTQVLFWIPFLILIRSSININLCTHFCIRNAEIQKPSSLHMFCSTVGLWLLFMVHVHLGPVLFTSPLGHMAPDQSIMRQEQQTEDIRGNQIQCFSKCTTALELLSPLIARSGTVRSCAAARFSSSGCAVYCFKILTFRSTKPIILFLQRSIFP